MKAVRIDEYICLDVDKIVVDEMEMILSCKLRREDRQEDRDSMAKIKRAAREIRSHYKVPGS